MSDFMLARRAQHLPINSQSEELFSILTVCTGNVCRSPTVERLLAQKLGPTVSISSAGTHALVGHPISEPMARLLRSSGAPDGAFAARGLTQKLVKNADLVLTLTRAQRTIVVELWPPAVRRTFTVREFARLLELVDPCALPTGSPAERLLKVMPLVVAERGARLTSPEDDDVIDPFRLGAEIYLASFTQITAAVRVIATAILPSES